MKYLLIPLILGAGLAQADCAAPQDVTEQTICASPVLQRLEAQMQAALAASSAEDQQAWLAKRRVCGARLSCITSMTRQRVQALQQAEEPEAPLVWTAEENPLGEGELTLSETSLRIAERQIPITPVTGQHHTYSLPQGLPCEGAVAAYLTVFETGDQRLIMALFTTDQPPADPTPATYHAQPDACKTAIYRR